MVTLQASLSHTESVEILDNRQITDSQVKRPRGNRNMKVCCKWAAKQQSGRHLRDKRTGRQTTNTESTQTCSAGGQQHCQDIDEDAWRMWSLFSSSSRASTISQQTTITLHETSQTTTHHSSAIQKPGHQIIVLCGPSTLMSHTSV